MRKGYVLIGLVVLIIGAIILNFGMQTRVFASTGEWNVTYYTMTGNNVWGEVIGSDKFPTEFDYDPLPLVRERSEAVGFKAVMDLEVLRDANFTFTVTVDDGVIVLYLNGKNIKTLIAPDPDKTETVTVLLKAGTNNLECKCFQIVPVLEDDLHPAFKMIADRQEPARLLMAGGIAPIYGGGVMAFLGLRQNKTDPKDTENLRRPERKYKLIFFSFLAILIIYSLTVYLVCI